MMSRLARVGPKCTRVMGKRSMPILNDSCAHRILSHYSHAFSAYSRKARYHRVQSRFYIVVYDLETMHCARLKNVIDIKYIKSGLDTVMSRLARVGPKCIRVMGKNSMRANDIQNWHGTLFHYSHAFSAYSLKARYHRVQSRFYIVVYVYT